MTDPTAPDPAKDDGPQGRELRRNPRYPHSTIWSEQQREAHRLERDRLLEDAGLLVKAEDATDGADSR